MPITLNAVTGLLDADVVDDNFQELETFLKEGVTSADFNGKFKKYQIRRYTSGKIAGFNSGSKNYSSARTTARTGTFENNWIAGTPAITYIKHKGKSLPELASSGGEINDGDLEKNNMNYNHPLSHPFELLGYPGGSLYYDFQEEGWADPVSYYDARGWGAVTNWPPPGSPLGRFPSDECWSRWLTIPDAAGGVYVDEPCIAVITAQVQGNYFFTPALRVHGTNTRAYGSDYEVAFDPASSTDGLEVYWMSDFWKNNSGLFPTHEGTITEGMQHSAYLRLGLFADTNPIIWDDEFFNGDSFGNAAYGNGSGFNHWIGEDPTGVYAESRPDGVAKSRSWKKVTDLTYRVRQRGSYKVIGVVELKGRRRYNFSLKFRPAMTFGHVLQGQDSGFKFSDSYHEIHGSAITQDPHNFTDWYHAHNPGWYWGPGPSVLSAAAFPQTAEETYFYPGGDALVTNLIESSSISVEFFYGQSLSSVQAEVSGMKPNTDPTI